MMPEYALEDLQTHPELLCTEVDLGGGEQVTLRLLHPRDSELLAAYFLHNFSNRYNKPGLKMDGKAYSGLGDTGDQAIDDYWVNTKTLTRVNIDLSGFSGNAIQIRFRMATNGHTDYEHSNNHNQADPGFGGFYVDDIIVMGETILT